MYLKAVSALSEWASIVDNACIVGETLELTLKNGDDKQRLIQLLVAQPTGFDRIQVVEPTLEEIFVEKAGGLQ